MIETRYTFHGSDEKLIERIMEDDHVGINHMVLPKGNALPEHFSNSNVYMIIVSGQLTAALADQEPHTYASGSILHIPYNIRMNISNTHDEVLEFFVVKAPSPKMYPKG